MTVKDNAKSTILSNYFQIIMCLLYEYIFLRLRIWFFLMLIFNPLEIFRHNRKIL